MRAPANGVALREFFAPVAWGQAPGALTGAAAMSNTFTVTIESARNVLDSLDQLLRDAHKHLGRCVAGVDGTAEALYGFNLDGHLATDAGDFRMPRV